MFDDSHLFCRTGAYLGNPLRRLFYLVNNVTQVRIIYEKSPEHSPRGIVCFVCLVFMICEDPNCLPKENIFEFLECFHNGKHFFFRHRVACLRGI